MRNKNKVINLKKTLGNVLIYVDKRCDAGDYSSALSALFYHASKKNVSCEVYAEIADVYSEVGLYDKAIYFWYKYLTLCGEDCVCEALGGLAANYFYSGDDDRAGYYFDKRMIESGGDDYADDEVLDEYVYSMQANESQGSVSDEFRSAYRIVHSVNGKAKYKLAIEKTEELLAHGEFENALTSADEALGDSAYKGRALYVRAFTEYSLNKVDEAIKDLKTIIEEEIGDFKAYMLAAYVFRDCGMINERDTALDLMCGDSVDDSAETAKRISVAYDFDRCEDANRMLSDALIKNPYSGELMFTKGAIAFNDKDFETAQKAFSDGYYYTLSPILLYYRDYVRRVIDDTEEYRTIDLIFDIPETEVLRRSEYLIKLYNREERLPSRCRGDIRDCLEWALGTGNESLQLTVGLICSCANDTYKKFLASQLIDVNISDDVKRKFVSMLCERLYSDKLGVVYSGYYKSVYLEFPFFKDDEYQLCLSAYSYAFGIATILTDDEGTSMVLLDGAYKLQDELIKSRNISKIDDICALACAMFLYSNISAKGLEKTDIIYGLFNTEKEKVERVFEYARKKEKIND